MQQNPYMQVGFRSNSFSFVYTYNSAFHPVSEIGEGFAGLLSFMHPLTTAGNDPRAIGQAMSQMLTGR